MVRDATAAPRAALMVAGFAGAQGAAGGVTRAHARSPGRIASGAVPKSTVMTATGRRGAIRPGSPRREASRARSLSPLLRAAGPGCALTQTLGSGAIRVNRGLCAGSVIGEKPSGLEPESVRERKS